MVALPMHDRWQGHQREIAERDFQRTGSQPKFGRGPRNRLQASTIGRGVTELSNPSQTHLAPKMPADHSQTGGATIHLVDLHDMIDFAQALRPFSE